ncbi:MAG TPA: HD domain-containing phosphohydrolase [Anaerolineales bacterium]|nr:HD domain-containing phosphohydrolase [Anaerolineales bacterium]
MNQETLLIVEDNPTLRTGLQEMLGLEGFNVLTAANGREALEQMSSTSPDLILSDIAMPEMDGFAFFKEVRKQPEWISIPFLFLTARGEKEDILAGKDLGADDYLVKPLMREELVTAVRARLDRSQQLRVIQLQQAYETSLTVLANAIEVRDQYTRGHVERVMAYAFAVAEQLGWRVQQLEQLRFGAILHDIGKIHIREATLSKRSPLTPEERAEIRLHPHTGVEMIKDIDYLASAIPLVRHHHERWDGQGYPDGLAGEAIPLGARIVSVADSFDAMSTARPYSPARSPQEAYEEVLSMAGTQFDPAVVAAFAKAWEAWKIQKILVTGSR